MTLVHGMFALGTLAFAVPLVIHLLFRNRFRMMDWGAMHLLREVVRTNRRRIQIRNWILLLVRCAIPIALAMMLARPVVQNLSTSGSGNRETLVVVVDDSLSMMATDAASGKPLVAAKKVAEQIIRGASRGDSIVVAAASRIAEPASVGGRREAIRTLDAIRGGGASATVEEMIRGALAATSLAGNARSRIVVISDFGGPVAVPSEGWNALGETLQTRASEVQVSLIPATKIGEEPSSENLGNVFVSRIELDVPVATPQTPLPVVATVVNASDVPLRDAPVRWSVGGKTVAEKTATVPPRSRLNVTARLPKLSRGVHPVSVRVDASDRLAEDNVRSMAVTVARPVRAVIVRANRPKLATSQSDYLSIALSPFAFMGQAGQDAIAAEVVPASQMKRMFDKPRTDWPDVVIFAGVPEPPDTLRSGAKDGSSASSDFSDWLRGGGTVVFFDGDQVKPEAWNALSGIAELPRSLEEIETIAENVADAPSIETRFSQVFAPLASLADGSLRVAVAKRRRWRADEREVASAPGGGADPGDELSVAGVSDHSATVFWKAGSATPLAVARPVEEGLVLQFALAADAQWSSWPLRPLFLPMMQRLVLENRRSALQPNVALGNAWTLNAEKFFAAIADPDAEPSRPETLTIADPENARQSQSLDPAGTLTFTPSRTGVYQISVAAADDSVGQPASGKSDPSIAPAVSAVPPIHLAVTVPASESDLTAITQTELASMAKRLSAEVFAEPDQWLDESRVSRMGREIWRWVWALLLGLLLFELWWQRRGTLRRRVSDRPVSADPSAGSGRTTVMEAPA